jgi:outer membrane protein assembly factor BamB
MQGRWNWSTPLVLAAVAGPLIFALPEKMGSSAAAQNAAGGDEGDSAVADVGAQNVFPAAERGLLQLLSKAQQLVDQQRYAEAVQCLGMILDAPEDAFFRPNRKSQLYPGLKAEAQAIVGRLPTQGREIYELQYGARARQILDAAAASGDPVRLAEVSRRFFHTRAGYEATLLLGLHYWNHGSPMAAAMTLKRLRDLSPAAEQFEPGLSLTLAACWMRAGSPDKAEAVIKELRDRHPQAVVRIGGTESPLSGGLLAMIEAKVKAGQKSYQIDQWPMFRGNIARNAATSASGPLLSSRWRIPTTDQPYVETLMDQIQQSNRDQDRWVIPSLHPLVVNNVVLMRTARNLLAVDFNTGKRIWEVPGDDPFETLSDGPAGARPGADVIQFGAVNGPVLDIQSAVRYRMWGDSTFGTLASDGQRVFAVEDLSLDLGMNSVPRNVFMPGRRAQPSDPKAFNRLAAYDIATGKLVWHLGGSPDEVGLAQAGTFFLGPPLPLGGQLYAIGELKGDIRLFALDAKTGDLAWTQQLAVIDQDREIKEDPLRRVAGVSPAYADGILVCPTSNKSVVALEPATRSLLWGYVYKSSDSSQPRQQPPFFSAQPVTDPEPANRWADSAVIVAEGRVLMTPIDSGELHCLSVLDGKPQWRKPRHDNLYLACVHQGKAVVVGRRSVQALRLSDGEAAWERKLEGAAMPSGMGFLSEGRYYIPLSTAEVVAIDLSQGKIVHTYRSRRGVVPGNLVSSNGKIVSQCARVVEQYFQLDVLRKEVDARLAAKPDDAQALTERGEILWDEGKLPEAVECLRRALAVAPGTNARGLLRDALLESLKVDFAHYRQAGEEIQRLIDEPRQQGAYLRLMAEGFEREKQPRLALEHYLKLIELDRTHRELEAIDRSHSVRRDRWIRVKLAQLWAEANPEVRAEIDRVTKARLDAAVSAGGAGDLQSFLDYFGAQPSGDEARAKLAVKLRESHRLLQAEAVLRRIERSPDRERSAAALAELAAMLREAKLTDDAAVCYAKLRRDYAEIPARDGKTGRQLADALPAGDPVRRALEPAAAWPKGAIVLELKKQQRPPEMTFYSVTVPFHQEDRGPFFSELNVELHQNPPALRAMDGWGKRRWEVPLGELMRQDGFPMSSSYLKITVRDHLLLLSIGFKVVALDTLAATERGMVKPKVVWTQDLEEPVRPTVRRGRVAAGFAGGAGFRIATPFAMPQFPANLVASISEQLVCYQRYQNLYGIDPMSGEILWVRDDIRPDSTVFGDQDYVLVVPPDKSEATILRSEDGRTVGTSPSLPSPTQRLAMLGRRIVSWRLQGRQMELGLIDPVDGRPVWPAQKYPTDAKAYSVDNQAAGILEPKGHFTLVSLADGRKLIDWAFQPDNGISDFRVVRSAEQTLLIVSGLERPSATGQHYYQLQSVSSVPLGRAKIYAFDPQGKPLWKEPVSVRNQYLLLQQPARLPALIFACQVQDRRPNMMGQPQTTILAVDKRTGQVCQPKDRYEGVSHFRIEGDPEKYAIDIRLQRNVVSLNFTNKPWAPAAKPAEKIPSASPSSALLKALKGGAERTKDQIRQVLQLPAGADGDEE